MKIWQFLSRGGVCIFLLGTGPRCCHLPPGSSVSVNSILLTVSRYLNVVREVRGRESRSLAQLLRNVETGQYSDGRPVSVLPVTFIISNLIWTRLTLTSRFFCFSLPYMCPSYALMLSFNFRFICSFRFICWVLLESKYLDVVKLSQSHAQQFENWVVSAVFSS